MLTYVSGDIFQSDAQVLVNTVNCVGVMGKGLALQFKQRMSGTDYVAEYQQHCRSGRLRLGRPTISQYRYNARRVMNFPTKQDWRNPSQLAWIETGLRYIADNYQTACITSIALPPLGCGNGGLSLEEVDHLICTILGDLSELKVYCYYTKKNAPSSTEGALCVYTGREYRGCLLVVAS